jgi:hypothetical protein
VIVRCGGWCSAGRWCRIDIVRSAPTSAMATPIVSGIVVRRIVGAVTISVHRTPVGSDAVMEGSALSERRER